MELQEKAADCGNADTATTRETLGRQPEELSKGNLIKIEGSSCDRKDDHVPEVVLLAKVLTLEDLSKIFHVTESSKGEMLEANPTFERNMTIQHGREKCPVHIRSYIMRRQVFVPTTPEVFLQRNKTQILNVSYVLNYMY